MAPPTQELRLDAYEEAFVSSIRLLTGRTAEECQPQIGSLKAIIQTIRGGGLKPSARCDLLNRVLLTLSIRPMSLEFYNAVFKDVDFNQLDSLKSAVDKCRAVCMLEFGNFRYGYKRFNEPNSFALGEAWDKWFPSPKAVKKKKSDLKARPKPEGLRDIPADRLFALGYIARESAPKITEARCAVKPILDAAIKKGVKDWAGLENVAAKAIDKKQLGRLLEDAALPDVELLLGGDLFLQKAEKKFEEVVRSAAAACSAISPEDIQKVQEIGRQNTATYLAMHDVDVYVATSMREPVHFTSNNAFMRRLFQSGALAVYRIRYFDPTQSYLPDRIQKGLVECLMIKRSALTVYNAQEGDTFGKDSELGVTLAQNKPAIVYVTRFFHGNKDADEVYSVVDSATTGDKAALIALAEKRRFIEPSEAKLLAAPEKSKGDVVGAIVNTGMRRVVTGIDAPQVCAELLAHGYAVAQHYEKPHEECIKKIAKLEARALTFKDVHPLSLQTGADGVARGVLVTRTVEHTAELILALLTGSIQYEIRGDEIRGENDKYNWLLCEKSTGSPVRVVTKDRLLTVAFWSEDWSLQR
ncbi:MAG: hypothetical protein NTW87_11010 [Planctomycetota bacterium]|nr:hypothetical protein [Planctomycetota bacterium]